MQVCNFFSGDSLEKKSYRFLSVTKILGGHMQSLLEELCKMLQILDVHISHRVIVTH